jgi:hypothetical protein
MSLNEQPTPHQEKVGRKAGRAELATLERVATERWCVSNANRGVVSRPVAKLGAEAEVGRTVQGTPRKHAEKQRDLELCKPHHSTIWQAQIRSLVNKRTSAIASDFR